MHAIVIEPTSRWYRSIPDFGLGSHTASGERERIAVSLSRRWSRHHQFYGAPGFRTNFPFYLGSAGQALRSQVDRGY